MSDDTERAAAADEEARLLGEITYNINRAISLSLKLFSITRSESINQAFIRAQEARFWIEQATAMSMLTAGMDEVMETVDAIEEQAEKVAALTDDPEDVKELLN